MIIVVENSTIEGIYRTSLTLKLSNNNLLLPDNGHNWFWLVYNYRHDEIHTGYPGQMRNSNLMAIIIVIITYDLF